jgi:hypothetical protein
MLRSAIPTRFQKAWAVDAAGAYIRVVPVASQIGIQDGAASFETGWVPDNFTPLAGGGVPPFGQDFNGVTNIMTTWDQWYQAGAPIGYDLTFATAIGGYPQGAVLDSSVVLGKQWLSLVDGNLTDPDDPLTSTNWRAVGIPSGTPQAFLTSTLPADFVPMNGLTIGNASSNATALAAASALFLFAANWSQFSNTQCPILTSAGAPSTRGANPYADFAANKQLTLPNAKGLGLIGADTMGGAASTFLSGVPVTIGNTTTPGSILGENLHVLTNGELATHFHNNVLGDPGHSHGINQLFIQSATNGNLASFTFATPVGTTPSGVVTNLSGTGQTLTNANSGSNVAHNTTERNMIVYWGQRL